MYVYIISKIKNPFAHRYMRMDFEIAAIYLRFAHTAGCISGCNGFIPAGEMYEIFRMFDCPAAGVMELHRFWVAEVVRRQGRCCHA